MTDDDYQPFVDELTGVAETLGETVSAARIEGCFRALQDLLLEAVLAALQECARTKRWLPKPAEIREVVEGTAEERAERAWAQLLEATRLIGSYRSVEVEDPGLAHVINGLFGGWPEAVEALDRAQAEPGGPGWQGLRKQVLAAYRGVRARADAPIRLLGLSDRKNASWPPVGRGALPEQTEIGVLALAGVRLAWRETRALLGRVEHLALLAGPLDPEAVRHDTGAPRA